MKEKMWVMKCLAILLLILISGITATAQTFDEWFKQKKTQKKYLLEQIAALQVYAGFVQQGYSIAKDGLGFIHGIKQGDWTMHGNYFNSLQNTNPIIKGYAKIAAVLILQKNIVQQINRTIRITTASNQFTSAEINYLYKVFNEVLATSASNLNELHNLVNNSGLKMKDDERLEAIDKYYADMNDRCTFIQSFCNSALVLAAQRNIAGNEILITKNLNGLP